MTESKHIQRKLTTILSVDAANYTGRMSADETRTIHALRAARAHIFDHIEQNGGRVANTAGDGLIAEFPSVTAAVESAVAMQQKLKASDVGLTFRMGLHLGDVILDGDDLLGDGVNIAARVQEAAPDGGIMISQQVADQVRGRLPFDLLTVAQQTPKHVPLPMDMFAVIADGVTAPTPNQTNTPPDNANTGTLNKAYKKTRDRFWISVALVAVLTLSMGPWILIFLAPVNIILGWLWLNQKRDLDK